MSRKISAPNIISGTHGKVWWDDSVIYEISSFEATLDTDREDVTFAGDMIKDSKLMSVSVSVSSFFISCFPPFPIFQFFLTPQEYGGSSPPPHGFCN